jgi:voltage-gated potassium channel
MKPLLSSVGMLLLLTVIGAVGLRWIEGAPWLDCLFMAVISLTTVGYEESVVLSPAGRWFIIAYLFAGLGVFTYAATRIGQWIVSAEIRKFWEGRRMEKKIAQLRDHYIICGLGRMGTTIANYLHDRRKSFVVIDREAERLRSLCEPSGWLFLAGDATDDDVLRHAGIERAHALTTVLTTDADNVYVVLTARMLNARLPIIARASDDKAVQKLQHAGATRVVSPFSTGAIKMARFMLHPSIEDFLEVTDNSGIDLELAELQLHEQSRYIGQQLSQTDLREQGVMVLGVRRADGQRLIPPPDNTELRAGDCLFVFGSTSAVNDLIHAADS